MMVRTPESMRALSSLILACTLSGAPLLAQEADSATARSGVRWDLIDAVGYGGLGTAVGVAAAWDMEYDPGFAVIVATTAAGVLLGGFIGGHARHMLGEGRRPGPVHAGAVAAGAVLAGATVGALASALLINSEGSGTALGSDEQTFAVLVLTGGVLGGWFAYSRWDDLTGARLQMVPVYDRGGPGIRGRIRF